MLAFVYSSTAYSLYCTQLILSSGCSLCEAHLLPGSTMSFCCPAGRFNERMVLSLASNTSCLLVDDELNILPTSSHVMNIEPLPVNPDGSVVANGAVSSETELKGLAESLADTLVWSKPLLSLRQYTCFAGGVDSLPGTCVLHCNMAWCMCDCSRAMHACGNCAYSSYL